MRAADVKHVPRAAPQNFDGSRRARPYFYLFLAPGQGTVVLRFRPSDESVVQVAQTNDIVLAAGISTCASL